MRVVYLPSMEPIVIKDVMTCDLTDVCSTLFRIAQKHTPQTAFADVNELLHIVKIMESVGINPTVTAKYNAAVDDHIPAVARQSADYRKLRAQFRAALSTIADMGRKRSKTHKNAYYEGVHVGLRRAAQIAIMFLNDLNGETPDETLTDADEIRAAQKVDGKKPRSRIVR